MSKPTIQPRFPLGMTRATSTAIALGVNLRPYLRRYQCADWGDLPSLFSKENEEALHRGGRIVSSYELPGARRIFIVTEPDRQSTWILLSEDC